MTCDEYQEQASQYIDGELPDSDSEELFRHLSVCAECRTFLRDSLELRSKIQDEVLLKARAPASQPPSLASAVVLPLVTLVGTIALFLGISFMTPMVDSQQSSLIRNQPEIMAPNGVNIIGPGRMP